MVTLLALGAGCHTRTAADPSQEERAAREVEQGDDETQGGDGKGADDESKGSKDSDGKGSDGKGSDGKHSDGKGAAHPAAAGGSAAGGSKERAAGSATSKPKGDGEGGQGHDGVDPEDIEVSTSPQGLLKPGAEDQVRQKLGVDKGAGMGSALRKFQREHDLPATGMVDHETVIKLGLEPSDIFEKAD
jgi:putative peptidoglycan binding protein